METYLVPDDGKVPIRPPLDSVAIVDPVCDHRLYWVTCYIVNGTSMPVNAVTDVKLDLPSSM
jgi:hypothetical protein